MLGYLEVFCGLLRSAGVCWGLLGSAEFYQGLFRSDGDCWAI